MATLEASSKNSQTFEERAKKTALSRWKLESLAGLLGLRSLTSHQKQSELNQAAENRHARKTIWGFDDPETEGDEMGHTILGDVTNPTPIVINSPPQQQSNGLGKVLAGAAIGAALIGVPGAGIAGFFLNQLLNKPAPAQSSSDDTVDIGLLRIEDLKGN